MDDLVTVRLSRNDFGQILDGLECRRDVWRVTARYLNGEQVDEPIEECSDAHEAEAIADTYDRIMNEIRTQLSS